MLVDNFALRTARTIVASYAREDEVLEQHQQATDCHDCDAFLRLGIDAFNWIIRADQLTRQALYDGTADFDFTAIDDAIGELCQLWLKACVRAEQWIALQQTHHSTLDNLEEFRACCQEMQAIAKARAAQESEELPDNLRPLRDKAIEEHRNGQTAEFI
jgi:hypothetical protein